MQKKREWLSVRGKNRLQKLFRIMKLTFFLCVFFVGSLQAAVNAQHRLTMKLGEVKLEQLFDEIQKQTHKIVVYNNERVSSNSWVVANYDNTLLEEILDEALRGTGLSYKLMDDYIVLVPQTEKSKATPQQVEETTIKGTVVDENNSPLPGVTVILKGTALGTATDVNGKFSLKVPKMNDLTLVFSFIGMETQEVKPGNQKDLKVKMVLAKENLEEVVVTGIFERKAESFTGSTVSMKGDDLKKVGNQNVFQSLKSLDPSLMIFDNMEFGSDPNKNPKMTLRGASSIEVGGVADEVDLKGTYANDPNSPLFILDGFEATVQKIMDLDMDRVASLTILKDASAKAS